MQYYQHSSLLSALQEKLGIHPLPVQPQGVQVRERGSEEEIKQGYGGEKTGVCGRNEQGTDGQDAEELELEERSPRNTNRVDAPAAMLPQFHPPCVAAAGAAADSAAVGAGAGAGSVVVGVAAAPAVAAADVADPAAAVCGALSSAGTSDAG